MADLTWTGETGRDWVRQRTAIDRQMAPVWERLSMALAPIPGERIVDLGCGAGTTTLAIAEAVGPAGQVTGLDISPDLVAEARNRAAGMANVTILEADAATFAFPPQAFDALCSRHGCMFFDDPAAAFANIRHGLRPGARVAMSAFGPLAENPWATVPLRAVETVLGPSPDGPPGPAAGPGPFAWADPSVFETALGKAGFRDIAWTGHPLRFAVGADGDTDPVSRAVTMVLAIGVAARRVGSAGAGVAERVRPALREALAPHVEDGWVRLPAHVWIITATA